MKTTKLVLDKCLCLWYTLYNVQRNSRQEGRVYPNQLTGDAVMEANETGEHILLEVGRPPLVQALGLPLSKWRDHAAVMEAYDLQGATRINLSDLSATHIMLIVTGQVDENWRPNACAVLTFSGRDMMLIVPANLPWKAVVRKENT